MTDEGFMKLAIKEAIKAFDADEVPIGAIIGGVVGGLVILALLPLLVLPEAFFSAWVTLKLWGWFVVPAFGIAPPPFLLTVGLIAFISYLQGSNKFPKTDDSESAWKNVVWMLFRGFFFLTFGYLIHWWAS